MWNASAHWIKVIMWWLMKKTRYKGYGAPSRLNLVKTKAGKDGEKEWATLNGKIKLL